MSAAWDDNCLNVSARIWMPLAVRNLQTEVVRTMLLEGITSWVVCSIDEISQCDAYFF